MAALFTWEKIELHLRNPFRLSCVMMDAVGKLSALPRITGAEPVFLK